MSDMTVSANTAVSDVVDRLLQGAPIVERQELAESGKTSPAESQNQVSPEEIAQAVSSISEYVQNYSRDLQFEVDDQTGFTIVRVIDSETEEIVRQIPSEEVVAVARYIAEYGYDPVKGLLMNGQG